MRYINEIIVHCTATPEGRPVTVDDIERWHRWQGYACIGYHFVVYANGDVKPGRPVEREGAHCYGHNAHSIGVCYVGGLNRETWKPEDTRTIQQKIALKDLLTRLVRKYPTINRISGHRRYAKKACPCFDATSEYWPILRDALTEQGVDD